MNKLGNRQPTCCHSQLKDEDADDDDDDDDDDAFLFFILGIILENPFVTIRPAPQARRLS